MLLLPLLLGVCLDATTLTLFGRTGEARARFMAQHLVGSLLLHWVLGITFMLFVTVSVLQLREVVHPELLSLIIRPQEPHPDLLGSLLQESGQTHARRMAMSLVRAPTARLPRIRSLGRPSSIVCRSPIETLY